MDACVNCHVTQPATKCADSPDSYLSGDADSVITLSFLYTRTSRQIFMIKAVLYDVTKLWARVYRVISTGLSSAGHAIS